MLSLCFFFITSCNQWGAIHKQKRFGGRTKIPVEPIWLFFFCLVTPKVTPLLLISTPLIKKNDLIADPEYVSVTEMCAVYSTDWSKYNCHSSEHEGPYRRVENRRFLSCMSSFVNFGVTFVRSLVVCYKLAEIVSPFHYWSLECDPCYDCFCRSMR